MREQMVGDGLVVREHVPIWPWKPCLCAARGLAEVGALMPTDHSRLTRLHASPPSRRHADVWHRIDCGANTMSLKAKHTVGRSRVSSSAAPLERAPPPAKNRTGVLRRGCQLPDSGPRRAGLRSGLPPGCAAGLPPPTASSTALGCAGAAGSARLVRRPAVRRARTAPAPASKNRT